MPLLCLEQGIINFYSFLKIDVAGWLSVLNSTYSTADRKTCFSPTVHVRTSPIALQLQPATHVSDCAGRRVRLLTVSKANVSASQLPIAER